MIEYFVEVPDAGIQEPVRTLDDAYPVSYTHLTLPTISDV